MKRRGVTLLYRHSLEARPRSEAPLDFRQIFAQSRILRTLPVEQELARIPMKLSAVTGHDDDGQAQIAVHVDIDPQGLTFGSDGTRYATKLDIAVFARDGRGKVLGEKWNRLDLALDADAYARLRRQHLQCDLVVPVAGNPVDVKVVIFEYDANRTAHATTRVRRGPEP